MKHYCKLTITFLFLAIISSCALTSMEYTETNFYDLGNPDKDCQNIPLLINKINLEGPYATKMVFRINSYQLKSDEYNRWALLPNHLLKKYLKSVCKCDQNNKLILSATINIFEIDFISNQAILKLDFTITDKSGSVLYSKPFSAMTKINGNSHYEYAEAMSNNAKIFTETLHAVTSKIRTPLIKPLTSGFDKK